MIAEAEWKAISDMVALNPNTARAFGVPRLIHEIIRLSRENAALARQCDHLRGTPEIGDDVRRDDEGTRAPDAVRPRA